MMGKGPIKTIFKFVRHFQGILKITLLFVLLFVLVAGVSYKTQGWLSRTTVRHDIRLVKSTPSPLPVVLTSPLPITQSATPSPVTIKKSVSGSSRYTVRKGDSLSVIAEQQLGSQFRWRQLYRLNQRVIGRNPRKILVGTTLLLPRR